MKLNLMQWSLTFNSIQSFKSNQLFMFQHFNTGQIHQLFTGYLVGFALCFWFVVFISVLSRSAILFASCVLLYSCILIFVFILLIRFKSCIVTHITQFAFVILYEHLTSVFSHCFLFYFCNFSLNLIQYIVETTDKKCICSTERKHWFPKVCCDVLSIILVLAIIVVWGSFMVFSLSLNKYI